MATITNKTRRPLNIPLAAGKKLRLGPLMSAEIALKAASSPAVRKLKEAGDVEITGTDKKSRRTAAPGKTGPATSRAGRRGKR